MIAVPDNQTNVMVVASKGYGKRSDIEEYRVTNRGGKGVKTINITDKTGDLIAIKGVTDKNDLMIINKSGIIIRLSVADLRLIGRATQGVRLINLKEGDDIAAVTKVDIEEGIEEAENPVTPETGAEYGNNDDGASEDIAAVTKVDIEEGIEEAENPVTPE